MTEVLKYPMHGLKLPLDHIPARLRPALAYLVISLASFILAIVIH